MQSAGFFSGLKKLASIVNAAIATATKKGTGRYQCFLVHSHEYYLFKVSIYFGMRFCLARDQLL